MFLFHMIYGCFKIVIKPKEAQRAQDSSVSDKRATAKILTFPRKYTRDRLQRKTTLVGNYISSTPNSQNDYRKIRTRKNFVFGHFTQRCLVSIFQFTKTVSITLPCSEPYETSKMPLTKRRYFHQTLHCKCLSKF